MVVGFTASSLLLLQTHLVGDLKHTGPGKATFFFLPLRPLMCHQWRMWEGGGEDGGGEVVVWGVGVPPPASVLWDVSGSQEETP